MTASPVLDTHGSSKTHRVLLKSQWLRQDFHHWLSVHPDDHWAARVLLSEPLLFATCEVLGTPVSLCLLIKKDAVAHHMASSSQVYPAVWPFAPIAGLKDNTLSSPSLPQSVRFSLFWWKSSCPQTLSLVDLNIQKQNVRNFKILPRDRLHRKRKPVACLSLGRKNSGETILVLEISFHKHLWIGV